MSSQTFTDEIKGVIFDLDGTLLDTLNDLAESMNFALRRIGLPLHAVDSYRSFIGEGVEMLVRKAVAPHSDETILSRCLAEFQKQYAVSWNRRTVPYKGIEKMFDELEAQRLFLGVLSNKPHYFTSEMVRYFFANRHFTVCIGNGIFPRKPDPSAAIYITSIMGIKPSNCLYVGDSGIDMETAHAAGMLPVGVLWGFRTESELRENGACWIVKNPIEIAEIIKCTNTSLQVC